MKQQHWSEESQFAHTHGIRGWEKGEAGQMLPRHRFFWLGCAQGVEGEVKKGLVKVAGPLSGAAGDPRRDAESLPSPLSFSF